MPSRMPSGPIADAKGTHDDIGTVGKRSDKKSTDGDSSYDRDADEEEMDRAIDQISLIKARTMYQMAEEISEDQKLLFLTSSQADLIAKRADSIKKMLNVLEVGEPQLVISLLMSGGYRDCVTYGWCKLYPTSHGVGVTVDTPPFMSREAELQAEQRIDSFMADVLLPLAASTNAIILCCADNNSCILSQSLTRVFGMMKTKWSSSKPFTILATTPWVVDLYMNPNLSAHWRNVRRKSRTWRLRHKRIMEAVQENYGKPDGSWPIIVRSKRASRDELVA